MQQGLEERRPRNLLQDGCMRLTGLLGVAAEATGCYKRPLVIDLTDVKGAGSPSGDESAERCSSACRVIDLEHSAQELLAVKRGRVFALVGDLGQGSVAAGPQIVAGRPSRL